MFLHILDGLNNTVTYKSGYSVLYRIKILACQLYTRKQIILYVRTESGISSTNQVKHFNYKFTIHEFNLLVTSERPCWPHRSSPIIASKITKKYNILGAIK